MGSQSIQKTNMKIHFQQPHTLHVRNASNILWQISFSDRTLHDTSANLQNSLQRGLTPLPDSEKIVGCRKQLPLQIVFLEAAVRPLSIITSLCNISSACSAQSHLHWNEHLPCSLYWLEKVTGSDPVVFGYISILSHGISSIKSTKFNSN